MHRLAATPGGWTPDTEGVIFVEQTPAPLVLLTAADTEIQSLACAQFPADFPALRVANLLQLQQQLAIDTYADDVLRHAQIIVIRLLGGRAYWPYGLEVAREVAAETGAALIVLPGDDRPAPDLISHSTVPLTVANQLWRYLNAGGVENMANGLMWACDRLLGTAYNPPEPREIPKVGVYAHPAALTPSPSPRGRGEPEKWPPKFKIQNPKSKIGLLFYRAHYLAGNTAPIDALCEALIQRELDPLPVFVSSLQDPEVQADLIDLLKPKDKDSIDVLLNTTSFSVAKLDGATPNLALWESLDVPVLQVILSGGTQAAWESQSLGLSPRDIAMNVALPEVDGRIITRAVSFKAASQRSSALETDVVTYEPVGDRIQFVADLAAQWASLRRTPVGDRRIAIILANYPNRDGRLANGVGLDTPQSAIEVLQALKAAGYRVGDIPTDGDALIHQLTTGITNDPEGRDFRQIYQSLSGEDYLRHFEQLPEAVRAGMVRRWGSGEWGSRGVGEWRSEGDGKEIQNSKFNIQNSPLTPSPPHPPPFPIPGLQLGHVFIGVQPSRGYDVDPALNYHSPDLEPTHDYFAFYTWLRHSFGAQAIVHLGKHGNLEWLPGKGVGLSADCYPEAMFGPMPHLYPFIVNDPGEGSQAKRRAQAVILDHLTPPLTRAELYGPLEKLEGLVDEYYEAQSLDPSRLGLIGDRILTLLNETHLLGEISPTSPPSPSPPPPHSPTPPLPTLLPTLDTYLCDLKEAQIRDGLHIFGRCPDGRQLRDLVVAIARHPGPGRQGFTRAIAESWGLDLDPLTVDPGEPFTPHPVRAHSSAPLPHCRNAGDAIAALEEEASRLIDELLRPAPSPSPTPPLPHSPTPLTAELHWIQHTLLPALTRTTDEIANLLKGLDGRYVPSGPAGAPTRNRPDVLPTGRNFFSVDIRAIPTESAWDVGRRAAEVLVEQYTQDHGEYPQTLGLSVWGTSTMRTGGDDLAEALALMGVRPVWDGPSRRVVDFEVLPISALGRPRVDVTLRISGFFRDAFPNLIDLFDQAVAAVAGLEEPAEQNPLAARVRQESEAWQQQGLTVEQAELRSRYRIFGSKPGAYGAGLQGLIESQNWNSDEDLARAYLNWSGYAYGRGAEGHAMPEAFEQRLRHLQVVLHNQDNREHDLLDSDDYYQFQGGMTVAARTLQGQQPATYFGDNAVTEKPKVRSLAAEIAKVYRSRVVNPKWIAGVMRHGYKGAFEMAATVDYLFAYDATARCVADHMYEGVAQAYVLDPTVQAFVQRSNPWALRDMAERLLEAHQRGLWATAQAPLLDALRQIAHEAEGVLEARHP